MSEHDENYAWWIKEDFLNENKIEKLEKQEKEQMKEINKSIDKLLKTLRPLVLKNDNNK